MSVLRWTATTGTAAACRVAGRRNVIRAARFVLHRARLDIPNDLTANGEALLQRWVLAQSAPGTGVEVVDVGANVGRWSGAMIVAAQQAGRMDDLDLHAFEPSSYTFARLTQALDGQSVSLYRSAVGDECGTSILHVISPGGGANSLHEPLGGVAVVATEEVPTTRLDEFADRAGLGHITLLKIDTEGHDVAVLRGARALLAERRISVVQFEYNHRWMYSRFFLRDAFDLLAPIGYQIGKLTPFGVEFYPGWDVDLETFVEGNYVACSASVAQQLPSVPWWKTANPRGRA